MELPNFFNIIMRLPGISLLLYIDKDKDNDENNNLFK